MKLFLVSPQVMPFSPYPVMVFNMYLCHDVIILNALNPRGVEVNTSLLAEP